MTNAPVTVSILATEDTSLSTLFGLSDVLRSVGSAWEVFVSGTPSTPMFDVRIVTATLGPLRCANGVVVSPDMAIAEAEQTDIVIVASYVLPASLPPPEGEPRSLEWLAERHAAGATIASACTGAVPLAQAGLLDGWEATTHWAYRDMFRRHFPKVHLRLDQGLCVSGSAGSLVTAGGNTSWQELVLYLTARYFSAEDASNTAKFWRLYNQERNQAAYMAVPKGMTHGDAVIRDCQDWITHHFMVENPVRQMIVRSGLSPTSFARRFRRATGDRPKDYVHALRIDRAKRLLETTTVAIDEVGHTVGYEDPASFRRVFKRTTSLTPSEYRRRFSHDRFTTE